MEDTNRKYETDLRFATVDLVSAYISNNTLPAADLPDLVRKVHDALTALGSSSPAGKQSPATPAVSVRRSIQPDQITCLECGRGLKMLKRHLRADHDMTPADYRAKWRLSSDYPMVAPNYAAARSAMAKKIGLGQKPGARRRRKRV